MQSKPSTASVAPPAPHPGNRCICVCVDDFGMHPGINQAAVSLVQMGRLHAIGCMVGGTAWQAGASMLKGLDADQVDIGLHLDFTETPLTPGICQPLASLLFSAYTRRLNPAAVHGEICAQLDAFESVLGRAPVFVDGHQHVHQFPLIRQILTEELVRRYSRRLPWLRRTSQSGTTKISWDPHQLPGWIKSRVIGSLGAEALAQQAKKHGLRQNAGLLGIYNFEGGVVRYQDLLGTWMQSSQDTDLLMCHPSAAAIPGDSISGARQAEFQVLGSDQFGDLVRQERLLLQPMSRLLARHAVPA